MKRESFDIFIAGGGPAGLIAAAALAGSGASILLADPAPRPDPEAPDADLRSTAFLHPARALFQRIGLWESLEPLSTPLRQLRIVDLAGAPPEVRASRSFDTGDPLAEPLGWNLMNDTIRLELLRFLDRQPQVELAFGCGFASLLARSEAALIGLTDGRQLSVRLAVAADGRASPLREAAGIGTRTWRYGQKALAFAVTHPEPHHGTSTELYLRGGPFTMVPLPDRNGRPASAIVWCSDGPEALRLSHLDVPAFEAAATERSAGVLGPLTLVTRRALWPVVTQQALRLTGSRLALIAEAAHVLPPIGAQGLNSSVSDIAALADLVAQAPDRIGEPPMLAAYEKARGGDLSRRATVLDLYNRLTSAPDPVSQSLRRIGLQAMHDIAPLREALMRAGMGPG